MKKKVIVACGGAVATSTVAAEAVRNLCNKNGIDVDIVQVRISEIPSYIEGVDLIVPTSKVKKDYGVPVITGMPFITGLNQQQTEDKILEVLKK